MFEPPSPSASPCHSAAKDQGPDRGNRQCIRPVPEVFETDCLVTETSKAELPEAWCGTSSDQAKPTVPDTSGKIAHSSENPCRIVFSTTVRGSMN